MKYVVRVIDGYGQTTRCNHQQTCARAKAVNGVSSAGLQITVHPAARAAAALRVNMAKGKFHCEIETHLGFRKTTVPFYLTREQCCRERKYFIV